jgi:hypothetical protein
MIDKFFSLFQSTAVHKIALLTGVCSQVIRTFEQEFAQDANSKDAAIDTLIDLLQKHKTSANEPVEPPAAPVAPEVPPAPVPNSIPVA